MNKVSVKIPGAFAVVSIASILVSILFQPILFHINSSLLTQGGDGLKNYYTYLYQIFFGSGNHFDGMNYPYGEHIVFTDNMPLLVYIITKVNLLFPGISNYAIGILHTLIFASIPVAALYAYKTLVFFKIPKTLSIFAAIVIVFSCQQYEKIEGHFGMAFLCYIPMQLYWLIRYHHSGKLKYLLWILVSCILFSFLHFYNLALILFLLLFYIVSYLIVNIKTPAWKQACRHLFPVILLILLAYSALSVYIRYTDLITDRTQYPYGVFGGATEGKDLFLNAYAPLGYVFQFAFGKASPAMREGAVYPGLVSILTLATLILIFIISRFSKRSRPINIFLEETHPRFYNLWLIAALFSLLLGMGFPVASGWQSLIDHISTLRQFRTVGRFSWIFYYLIQFYVVIILYRVYLRVSAVQKQRTIARLIFIMVIGVASIQSTAIYFWFRSERNHFKSAYNKFGGVEERFNIGKVFRQNNLQASDFQAIIALPYFHVGSEKLWIENEANPGVIMEAMSISIQSGLPMSNVMMSRTSWSQTFENVRLVDGPFSSKKILDSYNDKKILLIQKTAKPLYTNEAFLIQNATFLSDFGDNSKLYMLDKNQLLKNIRDYKDSLVRMADRQTSDQGLLADSSGHTPFYFVQHFDEERHTGKIGKAYEQDHFIRYDTVAAFDIPGWRSEDMNYQFLIWAKVNDYKYNAPEYLLDQLNEKGNGIHTYSIGAKVSTLAEDFWLLTDYDIVLRPETKKIILRVNNGTMSDKNFLALDEVLFIPQHRIYYYKKNGKLYFNNRLIK